MRPRLPIRRILLLRPFRPPNSPRLFTLNTLPNSRPDIQFLSPPTRKPTARYITTETKQWLRDELKKGLKYTGYLYALAFCLFCMGYGIQNEWTERRYNPPREWGWWTRNAYKQAKWKEDEEESFNQGIIDYITTGQYYMRVIEKLEDPNIDGAGLVKQADGGIWVEGIGEIGFDITQKSEPWRRGYHEALMGAARGAERLVDCVVDRKRNIVFPKSVVRGPSNPRPKPQIPGAASAPMEEDCEESVFQGPEVFYMRILTTKGFTEKQYVDAALGYAAWLEFRGTPDSALEMYKWALDIATAEYETTKPIIDKQTGLLNPNAGLPSANVLNASTALAVHHALNSNLSTALPLFLSVLRARRSLPDPPPAPKSVLKQEEVTGYVKTITSVLTSAFITPPYPPSPPDGTAIPTRTPAERCHEAGLMTNIGEILYVSQTSKVSKEDGLAWTREAVDIAEEQLTRGLIDKEGKKVCKECLGVAITNWDKMVERLANEERDKRKKNPKPAGWLGFGGKEAIPLTGRWESEELVVKERRRRASELLETVAVPKMKSPASFLNV